MSLRPADYEAELLRQWGGQTEGAHDPGHFRRVWKNCQVIAAEEAADEASACDMDVLMAAAFLHDLVNLPKNAPDRHRASALSAQAAVAYLRGEGFATGKLASVAHAIEAHSYSAGIAPRTLEAQVLQDADRLDALGAIGIARTAYVAGAMGSALFDVDDPLAKHRPLDDRRFGLDHFEVKLFRIAETMNTASGARLARRRVKRMRAYLRDLMDEIG